MEVSAGLKELGEKRKTNVPGRLREIASVGLVGHLEVRRHRRRSNAGDWNQRRNCRQIDRDDLWSIK